MNKQEAAIAFAQGRAVEWCINRTLWNPVDRYEVFDYAAAEFRLKPAPVRPGDLTWEYAFRRKPTPKRVPLGPEDVPPGSAIRHKGWPTWEWVPVVPRASGVSNVGLAWRDTSLPGWRWDELAVGYEISRDGGKTWEPCWKEVACDTK